MPSKSSQRAERDCKGSKEKSRGRRHGHREDRFPDRNSTNLLVISSGNHGPYEQTSSTRAQTIATHNSGHSQYQANSISGLPSATSWPNDATVPCQARVGYDLLGLNHHPARVDYLAHATTQSSEQSTPCPYHRTALQADFAGETSARGLNGIDRFMAEEPTEQGVVYFRGDGFHQNSMCYCLEPWRSSAFSLVGFGDEEFAVS